ncbi:ATP-binding protein [Aliiroseovarius sp. YM-037]|uniref:ATP-binding protein n=1 Tax=Aliiroseovarius sp. YM-037 TaxID=3341728 RepID=UPI003A7F6EDA
MHGEQLELDLQPPLPSLTQLWTPDDIFGEQDPSVVLGFKEDPRVERKRAKISQKALADYVVMWANTQPHGGLVLIGVENDGSVSGCKAVAVEHLNALRTVGRLVPDARFEFRNLAVKNSKGEDDYIVMLRVFHRENKLVENVSGDAFIREGDEKRKLTEAEKREIRLNRGELDFESEACSLSFPDDFATEVMAQFRTSYLNKRQLPSRYNVEDVLQLANLGKKSADGFKPTNACAILFALNARAVMPGCFIRVLRYDGPEERFGLNLNSVADRVFEGPLAQQIQQAEEYIGTQIRKFTRLGSDGKFASKPEYPDEVWLEAVVNAAVHRSYNLKQMNIYVKMFEDKFVVESPGSFMPPTTGETVYESHNPRNPKLMWGLYYFDYVQCAFEGTRRMREGMRQANLPDPVFIDRQSGTFSVTVTLENDVEHRKQYVRSEAAASINPEQYDGLSESEKMVVNYLAENHKVNVTDAGLVISQDWRGTKQVLDSLVSKGIVDRSPGKHRSRHRFYFLKRK